MTQPSDHPPPRPPPRSGPPRPRPRPAWQPFHVTSIRTERCLACQAEVGLEAVTTTHEEAPELLRPPEQAWFGFIHWPSGEMRAFVCCSSDCAARLLKDPAGPDPSDDLLEGFEVGERGMDA